MIVRLRIAYLDLDMDNGHELEKEQKQKIARVVLLVRVINRDGALWGGGGGGGCDAVVCAKLPLHAQFHHDYISAAYVNYVNSFF